MSYTFNPAQQQRLFAAIGRQDVGAVHLLEDIEQALTRHQLALDQARAGPEQQDWWTQTEEVATQLRAKLYALPDHASSLSAWASIGQDRFLALLKHSTRCAEALDNLLPALSLSAKQSADLRPNAQVAARQFFNELVHAFRNRLNIKPTTDPAGLFQRVLGAVLDGLDGHFAEIDLLGRHLDPKALSDLLETSEPGQV